MESYSWDQSVYYVMFTSARGVCWTLYNKLVMRTVTRTYSTCPTYCLHSHALPRHIFPAPSSPHHSSLLSHYPSLTLELRFILNLSRPRIPLENYCNNIGCIHFSCTEKVVSKFGLNITGINFELPKSNFYNNIRTKELLVLSSVYTPLIYWPSWNEMERELILLRWRLVGLASCSSHLTLIVTQL